MHAHGRSFLTCVIRAPWPQDLRSLHENALSAMREEIKQLLEIGSVES